MNKRLESSLGVDSYWTCKDHEPEYIDGILWHQNPPTSWSPDQASVPVFIPSIYDYTGFLIDHNMPCAVLPQNHAVYNCNKGVFEPSRKAQAEGWRLVQNDTKFKAYAYTLIYKGGLKLLFGRVAAFLFVSSLFSIGVAGLWLS